MDKLLIGGLLGFLVGISTRLVYDWFQDKKEKKVLREGLLLEVIYMHNTNLRYHLDQYSVEYNKNSFDEEGLDEGFSMLKYSTIIYDTHIDKLDRLLLPELCLQIHYYYMLINQLNDWADSKDNEFTNKFIKRYLQHESTTFGTLFGVVDVLLQKPCAKDSLQVNFKSLTDKFDDENFLDSSAKLLEVYERQGMARSIRK
jgi:hypothetical protein